MALLCAGLLFGAVSCSSSDANSAAHRPVKIVVGFGAGGAMDTLARAVAARLSDRLKRPVYVENRAGAGGAIAASYVAQARPDGNTLLLASPAEIFVNRIYGNGLGESALQGLLPVARLSSAPIVLVARSDSGIKKIGEIAAESRSRAQGLSFASSGVGSLQHLQGERLSHFIGAELVHVPYNGASTAIGGLLGKQVDLLLAGVAPVASYIESKKLRVLGVAAPSRLPQFPDIPTFKEAGVTGPELEYWQGIFLPQGTSLEVANAWAVQLQGVLVEDLLAQQLAAQGFLVAFKDRVQFSDFLREEETRYQGMQVNGCEASVREGCPLSGPVR